VIPWFYAFAAWVVRLTLTFWRFRVVDADKVPAAGPVILACNHVSYFDPPALGVASPRPVTYMAKRELFSLPVLGPVISWLGAFPVDRSRGDVAAIRSAIGLLERGAVLGIFPEGTRNKDGKGKAQMGVALLASLSGSSVVPAYIDGSGGVRRFERITVAFGDPVRFEPGRKASREDLAKWTDELMKRIYALREKTSGN
jgi:1-acyl-sn-glycerol-3-phosphate acyltransferase